MVSSCFLIPQCHRHFHQAPPQLIVGLHDAMANPVDRRLARSDREADRLLSKASPFQALNGFRWVHEYTIMHARISQSMHSCIRPDERLEAIIWR